jgi:hypothetical protein
MNYDRPQLLDRLAAEYVLGSMPTRARRRFERLRAQLPAADDAAHEWERRLMPLSTPVPALEPPRHVWDRIDRRTGGNGRAARSSLPAWLRPALGFAVGAVTVRPNGPLRQALVATANRPPVSDPPRQRSTSRLPVRRSGSAHRLEHPSDLHTRGPAAGK